MSRHKARETAFLLLFQLLEGENEWESAQPTLAEAELSAENAAFAAALARGAWEKRFETEQYIRKLASSWQYERLFSVDRVLLHLAMYELKYLPETPAAIVLDETIELAKQYGADDSPAFVNAVLDNFRRQALVEHKPELEPDEAAIAAASMAYAKRAAAKAPKPEQPAKPQPPAMPITEQFGQRTFRKIAKNEQTAADKILPEPLEEERPNYSGRGEKKY